MHLLMYVQVFGYHKKLIRLGILTSLILLENKFPNENAVALFSFR